MQDPAAGAQTVQWALILEGLVQWLWVPAAWVMEWQSRVYAFILGPGTVVGAILAAILLLLPATVVVAGVWFSLASIYTVPFRLGRAGSLLVGLIMVWWDALRMSWLYWAGIVRFIVRFVGWGWGLIKVSVQLVWGTLKGAIMSPLAVLDATSRRPGVPWPAFFLLILWSAIEATIFTFTLRPTMTEVLSGLTGYEVSGFLLSPILWLFLWLLIAGSFACIQVLNDAIVERQFGNIIFMIVVELAVALFEVLFLYRELVDAMTPWFAQQGWEMGAVATLSIAFFGWVGVRGMTWFLFGRFGAPAMLGLLSRRAFGGEMASGGSGAGDDFAEFWRGPINALKAEQEWFKKESKEAFELVSLPVLQLVAAALNFGFLLFAGRTHFSLPFRTIEDALASTSSLVGRGAAEGSH